MKRVTAVLRAWLAMPHIGIPALVGAGATVLLPPYLYVRQFRHVVGSGDSFIYDFSFFYQAAQRFVADPTTLYADPLFVYPPPSVLSFLPALLFSQPVAYLLWNAVVVGLTIVSLRMTLRLYTRSGAPVVPAPLAVGVVLAGLGSGPVFQNLKYGQVNVLVLLAVLAFLTTLRTDRPLQAALALCAGFWLKLYPLVLLPLAWGVRRAGRFGAGMALGLVGAPLLLLPVIPGALYAEFFAERVPLWAGITSQGALNASLAGVLTRLTLPPEAALRAVEVAVPAWVSLAGAVATAVAFGGVAALHAMGRLRRETAGLIGLALIPVCSTLGWEHVYLLALPLAGFALLDARGRSRTARILTCVATLMLMMPRPPISMLTVLTEHAPRLAVDLLNARCLLATLALAAAVAVWSRQPRGHFNPERGGE